MRRVFARGFIFAALAQLAIGVLFAQAASAQEKPTYLRLRVNPKTTIYVKFHKDEMRMAATAKKLARAKPVKMAAALSPQEIEFPEVALPLSSRAMPSGFTSVRACFVVNYASDTAAAGAVYGHFNFICKDSKGAAWEYLIMTWSETGPSPNAAPLLEVPVPKEISLQVRAESRGREVGIWLTPMSGDLPLFMISQNGTGTAVRMSLLDSKRKVVHTQLAELRGFEPEHTGPFSVIFQKPAGSHTCRVALDAGPLGGRIRAHAKIEKSEVEIPSLKERKKIPAYYRISVDSQTIIYAKLLNDRIYMSTSIQGLDKARPIKPSRTSVTGRQQAGESEPNYIQFPEVRLPVSAGALPAGFSRAKITWTVYYPSRVSWGAEEDAFRPSTSAGIVFARSDDSGAQWDYSFRFPGMAAGPQAESAPEVELSAVNKLAFEITAEPQPEENKVGIAAILKAGTFPLTDPRKNGKSVNLSLRVLDSRGKTVVKESGPLSKFGFT